MRSVWPASLGREAAKKLQRSGKKFGRSVASAILDQCLVAMTIGPAFRVVSGVRKADGGERRPP
jgi:hypothetical protein